MPFLRAVEILYGEGTKLERDLAYADAMRRLHESYPEDDEAKVFYALAILGTAHDGRDHVTYMRAASLAEEVFASNPRHPGAVHYERLRGTAAPDSSSYAPSVQAARVQALELEALLRRDSGVPDVAIELLAEAASLEEAMPYEYGPPPVVKPSHELLGEVLLELGRTDAALAAFEVALARAPRRTASLLGLARAAERMGDARTAGETYALLSEIWAGADPALDVVREAELKAGIE